MGIEEIVIGGLRIVERRRVAMFGRQPVVECDHRDFGARREVGADAVMAVQPADDETAAVEIEHHAAGDRIGCREAAYGERTLGVLRMQFPVPRAQSGRMRHRKTRAHRVVGLPHIGERRIGPDALVEAFGLADEVSDLVVEIEPAHRCPPNPRSRCPRS